MYRNKKISVYFPCRNEAGHLEELLKTVPNYVDEVIIVSNKSTDNTVEKAKELGVKVVEDNRTIRGIGYGFAHISGTQAATGDIVVAADGDMTYPIDQIDKMIDRMLDSNVDFISCNRYPVPEHVNIPFFNRLGVTILNIETKLLHPNLKIQDILTGMWLFKREIKDELHMTMGDWNMSPEIKIHASSNPNISFEEYHIEQRDRLGESKQMYWKTGLSHLAWIFIDSFTMRGKYAKHVAVAKQVNAEK